VWFSDGGMCWFDSGAVERSNYKGKQLTLPTAKKGMQPDGTNHIFFQQEHPWVFDVSLSPSKP
jgi:hypothetical protein